MMSEKSTWDFGTMLGMGSARDIFMHKIMEIAETNKNIMYITADGSPAGSMQDKFRKKFPDQFIEGLRCELVNRYSPVGGIWCLLKTSGYMNT